jgi:peroxiredoxin (alkyl hydroperoxide reductase subunit C)
MIGLGQKCPDFKVPALVGEDINHTVSLEDFKGKWLVIYFYPHDFTFVCPTEIKAFSDATPDFEDRNCAVIGGSCDSVYDHLGWVRAKDELKNLKHPLFADFTKCFARSLGVLNEETGAAVRATFIVDPDGIARFVYVTDPSVGREPKEVLRVLDALQSGELCPCGWQPGQPTIKV